MPPKNVLQRSLRRLRREVRRIGGVTVTSGSVAEAQVETLLSHGGRELSDVLEQGKDALRAEAARYCAAR